MAGLLLNGSAGVQSAAVPSGPTTIGSQAYGVGSGVGTNAGPKTAAVGSVSIGALALGVLMFMWYSLPR